MNKLNEQIENIISKEEVVVLLFLDKNNIIQESSKEDYDAKLKKQLIPFVQEFDRTNVKTYTLNINEYLEDAKDFIFNKLEFPCFLIFHKGIVKYARTLQF